MKHKTRIHDEMDDTIKTLREVAQKVSDMIDEDMTLTEAWIPIEDFDSDHVGLCWVLFRGVVKEAMRRKVQSLRSVATYQYIAVRASGLLSADEITHIIPLHKPEPPNGK